MHIECFLWAHPHAMQWVLQTLKLILNLECLPCLPLEGAPGHWVEGKTCQLGIGESQSVPVVQERVCPLPPNSPLTLSTFSMEDWRPGTGLTLTHPRALIPALHQLNPSPPWSLPLPQRMAWGGEGQAETALLGGEHFFPSFLYPNRED